MDVLRNILDDRFDEVGDPDVVGDINRDANEDDRGDEITDNHGCLFSLRAIQWRLILSSGFVFPNGRPADWAGLRRSPIERMTFDASH